MCSTTKNTAEDLNTILNDIDGVEEGNKSKPVEVIVEEKKRTKAEEMAYEDSLLFDDDDEEYSFSASPTLPIKQPVKQAIVVQEDTDDEYSASALSPTAIAANSPDNSPLQHNQTPKDDVDTAVETKEKAAVDEDEEYESDHYNYDFDDEDFN